VAGAFYPGNAAALSEMTDQMLAEAATAITLPAPPKALIAPHAGYVYSGPIAASAYTLIRPYAGYIRCVVLLGPVHRVPVRGIALPEAAAFSTPLGEIALNSAAMSRLADLPQVKVNMAAHAWEHSLEVQLPFLQTVLDNFELVPLAVGDATPGEVAEVLDRLWGDNSTLIVISSDLSHYLPYEDARRTDEATSRQISELALPIRHAQACGATPINGLLDCARQRQLTPHLLDLRNSGDTAGDRARVVGYCAFAFTESNRE